MDLLERYKKSFDRKGEEGITGPGDPGTYLGNTPGPIPPIMSPLEEEYEEGVNNQFLGQAENGGAAPNDVKPMSYADIYNSTINEVTREKEDVSKGRTPTLSNTKISIGEDKINININKIESDIINTRDMTASRVYNSIPQTQSCGVTTNKDTLDNKTIEDRINPEILKQFKDNPYTQPLDSYALH